MSEIFNVTISAVNDGGQDSGSFRITLIEAAPVFSGPITPKQFTEGTVIEPFDVSTYFSGKYITFSAEGLPDGLEIDPSTGVISGAVAG